MLKGMLVLKAMIVLMGVKLHREMEARRWKTITNFEALVDGMADYGVDFVLQKIAAIKNRRKSETEV